MEPWFRLDPFQGVGGGGREGGRDVYRRYYTFSSSVFLDDCVTFRSSGISIYFQPEQRNFRSKRTLFVLIHLLSMQLGRSLSSTCFPAISSGYRPFLPLRYLFIDDGIKKAFNDAHRTRNRCCDLAEERGKVEVRSLETRFET